MSIRKRILTLVFVGLLGAGAAACGTATDEDDNGGTGVTVPAESTPTTVGG